jgi:NAD(P)-dependent dehydrogenase (short-subunit alcohol dehydrogenase family)
MMTAGRLSGKRVLLTGASSGIGLEAARLFAADGARLALLARGREALEESARKTGPDTVVLPVDLADRGAVEEAVEAAVARLGGLDIVVSNAAAGAFGHLLEVDPDDFDRAVDITFRGAVNVVRAALPHLRDSRGTIVATGSVLSRVPMGAWSSYVAAKHALRGFLNTISIEEREQRTGVRVAMVQPGVVDTPFWAYATSATRRKPRVVPQAYAAGVVARALVESAVKPKPEVLLGGATLLLDSTFALRRRVAERMLVVADRWVRSGGEKAPRPGSLWEPTGRAQVGAGVRGRDSILAAAQVGRRARPDSPVLLRLLRQLGTAAREAATLRDVLQRPVPEERRRSAACDEGRAAAPREPTAT